jgi:hypothetical protein
MLEPKTHTLFLCGEVSEIITSSGTQNVIRVLCKPDYVFVEGNSIPDLHLGERVIITLQYETTDILPFSDHKIQHTN